MTTRNSSSRWTHFGKIGIWAVQFRFGDPGFVAECAAELEEMGYGALWFPGGRGGDVNAAIPGILGTTRRTVAAAGIVNIWMHEPAEVGGWWQGWRELAPVIAEIWG